MKSTKEAILAELAQGLQTDAFVMDEKSKTNDSGKSQETPTRNNEMSVDATVLKLIDGADSGTAALILEAYKQLPEALKTALGEFYDALDNLGKAEDLNVLVDKLEAVKNTCGNDEDSLMFYEAALKDAKKFAATILSQSVFGAMT